MDRSALDHPDVLRGGLFYRARLRFAQQASRERLRIREPHLGSLGGKPFEPLGARTSRFFHVFSLFFIGFPWFLHGFGWDSGSGSISNSIFSLFQAITGGNDWHVFISVFEDYVGTNTSTWPGAEKGLRKHPKKLRKLDFAGFF